MAVMGDTNCDLTAGGEEAELWKALLSSLGLSSLGSHTRRQVGERAHEGAPREPKGATIAPRPDGYV